MKLTTKGRYGTRALLELALNIEKQPVYLKDIAFRQQIPLAYLVQIVSLLISGGIVRSTRGVRGGISLVKDPSEIKLSEVIKLLEGSIDPAECIEKPKVCERADTCVMRDVWIEMKNAMDRVLESTTLQDLLERQLEKNANKEEMYYI